MSVVSTAESRAAIAAGNRKGRWGALFAMAFAFVSDNTEGGLVNTLFPVIRTSLGMDLGALGILTSISRFARMLFGPLWAMAADKYGRKRVLILVTGVWGLWTAAAGLAQDFTQLLILYGIGVIGTVASEPISNGLLADIFEEDERGRAYGAIRSIGSAGTLILTPLIGQLSRDPEGWRYGMFIMGGISLLSGILILFLVKEPQRHTPTDDADFGKFKFRDVPALFKIPSVLLLAGMLPFVTSLVLFSFFVTYFVDVRGWENADAAILWKPDFSRSTGRRALVFLPNCLHQESKHVVPNPKRSAQSSGHLRHLGFQDRPDSRGRAGRLAQRPGGRPSDGSAGQLERTI